MDGFVNLLADISLSSDIGVLFHSLVYSVINLHCFTHVQMRKT